MDERDRLVTVLQMMPLPGPLVTRSGHSHDRTRIDSRCDERIKVIGCRFRAGRSRLSTFHLVAPFVRTLFANLLACQRLVALCAGMGVMLCAAEAQASCGDWLAGHEMEHPAAVDVTDQQEMAETFPNRPAPSQTPCQGPGCRNAPSAPAAPSAPVDASSLDRPEGMWSRLGEVTLSSERRTADHGSRVASAAGFPQRVERPPRH